MKRIPALLALVLLASVPGRAQLKAPAAAWKSAVAGAAAVVARQPKLREDHAGGPVPALVAVGPDGSVPAADNPAVLEEVASALELMGFEPEELADKTEQSQASVLIGAFGVAAARAEEKAESAAAALESLSDANFPGVAGRLAGAAALAPLLSRNHKDLVAAARASLAAFEQGRLERLEEFRRRLPERIANGEFNAENLIARDEYGWSAADEEPGTRHATLSALYAARLEALGRVVGPWTAKEVLVLRERLDRLGDAAELDRTGPESSRLARAAIESLGERSSLFWWNMGQHRAAMRRIKEKRAGAVELAEIERVMTASVDAARATGDHAVLSRVLAVLKTGAMSFPSWDEVGAARTAQLLALSRAQAVSIVGFFMSLVGAVVSLLLASGVWLPVLGVGALALAAAYGYGAVVMGRQLRLLMGPRAAEVAALMARHFPEKN